VLREGERGKPPKASEKDPRRIRGIFFREAEASVNVVLGEKGGGGGNSLFGSLREKKEKNRARPRAFFKKEECAVSIMISTSSEP